MAVRVYVSLGPRNEKGNEKGTHELNSWNMIKYLWALGHMPFWFHDVSSIRVKTSNTVLHRPLFLEGELSVYIHEMLLHTAGVLLQVNRVLQSAVWPKIKSWFVETSRMDLELFFKSNPIICTRRESCVHGCTGFCLYVCYYICVCRQHPLPLHLSRKQGHTLSTCVTPSSCICLSVPLSSCLDEAHEAAPTSPS